MGLIPQIPGLDGLAALGELPSLLQDLPNFLQSYEKAMLGLAQITEFVISSMENSKVLISVIQSYMEQLRCAVSSLNQSGFVDRIRDAISYVREAIDNIRNTIFKMYQSSFVGLRFFSSVVLRLRVSQRGCYGAGIFHLSGGACYPDANGNMWHWRSGLQLVELQITLL
ncbi:unnamed protein product [Penicillium bialowiezense]